MVVKRDVVVNVMYIRHETRNIFVTMLCSGPFIVVKCTRNDTVELSAKHKIKNVQNK